MGLSNNILITSEDVAIFRASAVVISARRKDKPEGCRFSCRTTIILFLTAEAFLVSGLSFPALQGVNKKLKTNNATMLCRVRIRVFP
jgi:hypothetical protein